jgi:hypothetical protein
MRPLSAACWHVTESLLAASHSCHAHVACVLKHLHRFVFAGPLSPKTAFMAVNCLAHCVRYDHRRAQQVRPDNLLRGRKWSEHTPDW